MSGKDVNSAIIPSRLPRTPNIDIPSAIGRHFRKKASTLLRQTLRDAVSPATSRRPRWSLTIAPHSLGARIHNRTEAIGTDAVDDAGIPDVRQTTRSQTHRPACGFLGVAPSTSTARKYPWTEAKALVGVARVLPEYSQLGAFRNTSPEARHTRPCAHCAAAKTPAKDHPRILMIATGETTLPVHREQSTTATS